MNKSSKAKTKKVKKTKPAKLKSELQASSIAVATKLPLALQSLYDLTEKRLKAKGLRMTQPRVQVLVKLISAGNSVTPLDIFNTLGSGIDRASVYRIFELLESESLIHKVNDGGYVFCSHPHSNKDKHLYLLCEKCESLTEAEIQNVAFSKFEDTIENASGFISKGRIQISGLCRNCV